MRGFAFVLAVALIEAVAPSAFAKDKIRLAQSSTVTNCMIDVQCAGCKLPDGLRPAPPSPSPSPATLPTTTNPTTNTACVLNCGTAQLACQTNCGLRSPSP